MLQLALSLANCCDVFAGKSAPGRSRLTPQVPFIGIIVSHCCARCSALDCSSSRERLRARLFRRNRTQPFGSLHWSPFVREREDTTMSHRSYGMKSLFAFASIPLAALLAIGCSGTNTSPTTTSSPNTVTALRSSSARMRRRRELSRLLFRCRASTQSTRPGPACLC